MRFASPFFLYALAALPFLILFLVWGWRRREEALRRFVNAGLDTRLAADLSLRRRRWKNIFLVVTVSLSLLSLARPQWGYRWEEVRRRGVDILIAVDVSKSMLAGDVSPSRLERAKHKVEDLLNRLQGDRVGLIAFAGRAYVLTPLTLDYGAIRLFLDSLSPDLITAQGTNVGEAVALALKSLKQGDPQSQSLLLMTDGEDLSGDALDAAKKAAEQGVRIYALGIGTEAGAPIPAAGGGFKKDSSGQMVLTKLDESVLEKMASATGGISLRSVADDRDIDTIYGEIQGKLEQKELKSGRQRHFLERYAWFLFPAFLFLLAEALMSETRSSGRLRKAAVLVAIVGILSVFGTRDAAAFNLPGQIQEGERLYKAGKYEEALEKFLSAQIDHPDDPRLQYNLGNTYYQLKRYEDAQRLFDAVSKSSSKKVPDLPERSLYNLGNSQFRSDKLEDAIQSYESALKIDPKDEDARYNLELAKRKLEQKKQQQQQQQQQQNKDQQKDQKNDQQKEQEKGQNQDQNKQGQQNQPQNKPEDQKQDQQQAGGQENKKENKEENKEKKEQGEEEKSKPEDQGQQKQSESPTEGHMSREEAARWLSTLQEGKRKIIPKGAQTGKSSSEKDW